ncbi:MAG: GNAT family N-acetyltransferase [Oscillospiraceae bacterium]|nr:GNAT family N-acetyltransferase [Oscillospiraceae bacterium]
MNNITIRLAIPADAPDMAEVHMRSWEVAYNGFIPADYIREKNAGRPALWQRIITEENTTQYVIQSDNKTVGIMCVALPQDDDVGEELYELHGLYLHPDYFRQGIGTVAMEFALNIARNLNKTQMTVWVFSDNTNSINFYKKCGFIADGSTKILQCGKPLTTIRMRRKI